MSHFADDEAQGQERQSVYGNLGAYSVVAYEGGPSSQGKLGLPFWAGECFQELLDRSS
jgi:hypothetical protein